MMMKKINQFHQYQYKFKVQLTLLNQITMRFQQYNIQMPYMFSDMISYYKRSIPQTIIDAIIYMCLLYKIKKQMFAQIVIQSHCLRLMQYQNNPKTTNYLVIKSKHRCCIIKGFFNSQNNLITKRFQVQIICKINRYLSACYRGNLFIYLFENYRQLEIDTTLYSKTYN
ncbi:unnamed protein product [Paramecium sonneborni]|uniref:Uncharacterized protein n=1 Tax=Paramecium sonneborni TaxID=65129 RepID=A0A8S1QLC4_9CILI|nr:unnamed protein product [Paramecium sonneborni]